MVDSSPPMRYNTHMKTYTLTEEEANIAYTYLREAYEKLNADMEDAVTYPVEFDDDFVEDAKIALEGIDKVLDKLAK